MAPVSAFLGGIPQNALNVLPLSAPTPELTAQRDEMAARERATPSDTGDAGTTPPGATPMRGQRLTRR